VIAMQYSRQHAADMFRRCGYPQLADEALRVLPDPIDSNQLQKWAAERGLTRGQLIDKMGGSP
jgi:hypothetical protein